MLEKKVKNNMKCKKNHCDGEVERAEEFGRCNKCGTVYRFDESGYYFVKNEDDPTQTEDKEKNRSRDMGMTFQATPPFQVLPVENSTCDVCGRSMRDDEGRECIALNIAVYDHPEADRVKEVFGKQSFHVCFVCFLRALGVKELKEEKKTVEWT